MNVPNLIEASVPLVAGLLATWLGFRRTESASTYVRHLRWLGPALTAFGVWQMGSAVTAEPPGITATTIATAMRNKLSPPWTIDEVTRGDGVDAVGKHVLIRATITRPPLGESDRERLLGELFKQARIRLCRSEPTRTWLLQGIGFEYEYTMGGKTYSPVIVVQKDCE